MVASDNCFVCVERAEAAEFASGGDCRGCLDEEDDDDEGLQGCFISRNMSRSPSPSSSSN